MGGSTAELHGEASQLHKLHNLNKASSCSSTSSASPTRSTRPALQLHSCSFVMSRTHVFNLPLFLKYALLLHFFCSSVRCALVNVQFSNAAPGEKLPADLLTNTEQWTPKAALTDTAVEAMECAVRCTQLDAGCKSFLTTNHTCYLGKAPCYGLFCGGCWTDCHLLPE